MTAPKLSPPLPNESERDYYWRHANAHPPHEIMRTFKYWRLAREIDSINVTDDVRRVLRSMLEFLA